MKNKKTVAVAMPVRNEEGNLPELLETVFDSVPEEFETQIVLAVNNSTSEFEKQAEKLAEKDERIHALQLGQLKPKTFALAYVRGLEYAAKDLKADYVVEIDAGGSFDPRQIPAFLQELEKGAPAVLSTRFTQGGKMVHPWQRKLVSISGTVLANLFLGLGKIVPDMTSGFEAFRGDVICEIFRRQPPENWISVNHGPGHFYQTEMRTYVCWLAKRDPEFEIEMVPIVMGAGKVRKPQAMPLERLQRAVQSLFKLRKERRRFI